MNDTFNMKRFTWFFKKTILERPMQLFGLIGLILLIDLLCYAIGINIKMVWDAVQELTFCYGFIGGGCFLASFVFNYFSSNARGASYLTLPASSFEKWLCGVLITVVLYTIIFLVFYRIMDTTFVGLYHKSLDPKNSFYKELYEHVNIFPYNGFVASASYKMFVNFTGAMLVGALYFNKAAFIKVALIVCGLFISAFFLNNMMANAFFNNVNKGVPFYFVLINMGKEFGKIELPLYASKAVDICILYIIPAVLLMTAYIRLREKEF